MKLFRVQEAAQKLEVSGRTVYELCATNRLRHLRIGVRRGTIRIPEDAIQEYLASAASKPADAKDEDEWP